MNAAGTWIRILGKHISLVTNTHCNATQDLPKDSRPCNAEVLDNYACWTHLNDSVVMQKRLVVRSNRESANVKKRPEDLYFPAYI